MLSEDCYIPALPSYHHCISPCVYLFCVTFFFSYFFTQAALLAEKEKKLLPMSLANPEKYKREMERLRSENQRLREELEKPAGSDSKILKEAGEGHMIN